MEFFRSELTQEPVLILTKELLVSSRIPRGLWNCEISKIPESFTHRKKADKYIKNLPALDKAGRGLYLHGPYGRGKSGMAVAIAKEAMRRGARVLFFSAHELDSIFGKTPDYELKNAVLKTHFLIFDDVGAEKAIPWAAPWVEAIIKLRNNDLLPTFITSNEAPLAFMQRIKSIASMLGGKYVDILVDGHDWRLDGQPKLIRPDIELPTVKELEVEETTVTLISPELLADQTPSTVFEPFEQNKELDSILISSPESEKNKEAANLIIKVPVLPISKSDEAIVDRLVANATANEIVTPFGNGLPKQLQPEVSKRFITVHELMIKTGKSVKEISKESGIKEHTINFWKNNTYPYMNKSKLFDRFKEYLSKFEDRTS